MATASVTSTSAWSDGVSLTTDTPVKNEGDGTVRIAWTSSAPASVTDGYILKPGEAIIVPGSTTLRWVSSGSVDSVLYYEEFGV